jgi:hypothetical protein
MVGRLGDTGARQDRGFAAALARDRATQLFFSIGLSP